MTDQTIPAEQISRFCDLSPRHQGLLAELQAHAEAEQIPIIGPLVGELLFILTRTMGARRVLELGTATGYSTLFLAEAVSPGDGRVVTVEQDPQFARRAETNFAAAGLASRIELMQGVAQDILAELAPPFDLAFLDIDKEGYAAALPHCRRLLRPGGLLVADNTAFPEAQPFNTAMRASGDWRDCNFLAHLPNHSPSIDGLCIALRL